MGLKIFVVDSFDRGATMESNSESILARLKSLGLEDKKDVRKFVVLAKVSDPDELLLVFGPALLVHILDEKAYRHYAIRNYALDFFRERVNSCKTKGGGHVTFSYFGGRWTASFGGASGDYGVYDKAILDKMQEVTDWLDMRVSFNWSDSCNPTEKKKGK